MNWLPAIPDILTTSLDWKLLGIVALIFAFAGGIKGVIGVGLPTIATGLLGAFIAPAQAAAIVILPALLTNVWQMWNGPSLASLLRRLWPMLTCVVLGTLVTARIITGGDPRLTVALLGAALTGYAAHGLFGMGLVGGRPSRRRFVLSHSMEPILGALAGLTTGLISGATGVFVVPTVPFLQAMDLDKDELIQAIGLTAFISALALGLGLGVNGGLGWAVVLPTTVAVVAAMAGMWLGQIARSWLSLDAFRRAVFIGLIGLGCSMVARGFF